ncbi:MAG: metallophosphoesterase [Alphaproteobacteria bacterium]
MAMWLIIMWVTLVITGMALVYLCGRMIKFGCILKVTGDNPKRQAMICGITVFGIFALIGMAMHFMNAIVCAVYFAMIWMVSDLCFWLGQKICHRTFKCYYAGGTALVLSVAALSYGWYLDHHVWQTDYVLTTNKNIENIKIAMFADSHIGTTFDADGFAEHIAKIQKQKPDMVVIVGDFVDDDTTLKNMIDSSKVLGTLQTKYGVYFVFGNHDKGYYGAERRGFASGELIAELEKNGVKVLRDETALINDMLYVIGRRDFSVEKEQGGQRKSMDELTQGLDKDKYVLVLDHQPTDYQNQEKSEVDLVVSGHTHGGQLFPFNYVGKWIGANDAIYGYERHGKTDFIVTSGISDWAIKFKTGTKSEFVIINLQKQ